MRSRRPTVLRCLHAVDATRVHQTRSWVVSFSIFEAVRTRDAPRRWSQALTTQNGCVLYLCAGLLGVYLVSRGRMTTGQLGLVLLYSASLQRAAMDYMTGAYFRVLRCCGAFTLSL